MYWTFRHDIAPELKVIFCFEHGEVGLTADVDDITDRIIRMKTWSIIFITFCKNLLMVIKGNNAPKVAKSNHLTA